MSIKTEITGAGRSGGQCAQRLRPGYIDFTFKGPSTSSKIKCTKITVNVFFAELAGKTFLFILHINFRTLCKIHHVTKSFQQAQKHQKHQEFGKI